MSQGNLNVPVLEAGSFIEQICSASASCGDLYRGIDSAFPKFSRQIEGEDLLLRADVCKFDHWLITARGASAVNSDAPFGFFSVQGAPFITALGVGDLQIRIRNRILVRGQNRNCQIGQQSEGQHQHQQTFQNAA